MRYMSTLLLPICCGLFFLSCELDDFMFNNSSLDEYKLPANTIPDSLITEVSFDSGGNTLYGFWVASNGDRPGITVLYFHGNRDHIDHYWDRVMLLHDIGVNIFVFDYRGFGKSEGKSSESGLYRDAEAALDYITTRDETVIDSLIVYGFSLGNVPAIYTAAELVDPLILISEAPFASANSLTQGSLVLDIPAGWITNGTFDNSRLIRKISTSFYLLHGTNDDFVRYRDNGAIIYKNAPQPKQQLLVPKASHSDIPEIMGEQVYRNTILGWINTAN